MSNIKRITVGIGIAALLTLTGGAVAQAREDVRPGGDGTGGGTWQCFRLTPWSPTTCIRIT